MSTPTAELGAIPFPSIQEPSEEDGGDRSQNVAESSSGSPGTSSRLTSSDKLTALLPPRTATNNDNKRTNRPSHFGITAAQRGYRRSLDASTSLPSFSTPVESDSWLQYHHSPGRTVFVQQSGSGHNSPGKETPRQRMSSESEQESRWDHYRHNVVQAAISRLSGSRGGSEPSMTSPSKRLSPLLPLHKSPETDNKRDLPPSPRARSRAVSPLRIFHQWSNHGHGHHHRGHRREEPFVPVNPFKRKGVFRFTRTPSTIDNDSLGSSSGPYECEDILPTPTLSLQAFFQDLNLVVTDSLPRQLYLNFLLRLPAMYFSRVSRIFEDAEVSKPDIQRMIDASCREYASRHPELYLDEEKRVGDRGPTANTKLVGGHIRNTAGHSSNVPHPPGLAPLQHGESSLQRNDHEHSGSFVHPPLPFPDEWTPTSVSPSLFRFKHSWEAFIDSLLREWKTFNIVSALLSSAIVSMFQVPEAVEDPVTRTAALLSLICSLMSLSYGCMYIVRFGTMRSMSRASNWAEEAQKTKTLIWWNVWVLLAMPAVWIAWAMILFLVAILSFVWRTGSVADPPSGERPAISTRAALGPRIAITSVFVLGMVYLFLIIRTLKKYGASRGKATEAILRAGAEGRMSASVVGDIGSSLASVALPDLGKNEGEKESVSRSESEGRKKQASRHGTERRGRERYKTQVMQGREMPGKEFEPTSVLGLVGMTPLKKVDSHANSF